MTPPTDVGDLELTDRELLTVLQNHGIDRRTLMKLFGVGAGVAAVGGSATGSPSPGNRIDDVYGASYDADLDTVPSGIVDHEVGMHMHQAEEENVHEGFPMVESPEEGQETMEGPETFFDPVGLHVTLGDVVQFTTHGVGLHTVTAFHPKWNEPPFLVFPDRVPTDYGFSSPPIAAGDSWLYRFTTKGVYDLLCLPHISLGMVMRLVVFDPEEDDISGEKFTEPGSEQDPPLPGPAATVLDDDALDPKNIVDAGEVAWSALSLSETDEDDS